MQIARHVVPNLMPLLTPQFLVCIPAFVIAEANLGSLAWASANRFPPGEECCLSWITPPC